MVTAFLAPSGLYDAKANNSPPTSPAPTNKQRSRSANEHDQKKNSLQDVGGGRRTRTLSSRRKLSEDGSMSTLGMHDFTHSIRKANSSLGNKVRGGPPPRVVISKNSSDIRDDIEDDEYDDDRQDNNNERAPNSPYAPAHRRQTTNDRINSSPRNQRSRRRPQANASRYQSSRRRDGDNDNNNKKKSKKSHRRRRDFARAPHLQAALDRIKERQERDNIAVILQDQLQQRQRQRQLQRRRPTPIDTNFQQDAPLTAKIFSGTELETIDSTVDGFEDWGTSPIAEIIGAVPPLTRESDIIPTLGYLSPTRLLHLSPDRKRNIKIASIARKVRKRQRKRLQQGGTTAAAAAATTTKPNLQHDDDYHHLHHHHHHVSHRPIRQVDSEFLDYNIDLDRLGNRDLDLIPTAWKNSKTKLTNLDTRRQERHIHGEMDTERAQKIQELRKVRNNLERTRPLSGEVRQVNQPPKGPRGRNNKRIDNNAITSRGSMSSKTQNNRQLHTPPVRKSTMGTHFFGCGYYDGSSEVSRQPMSSPLKMNDSYGSSTWTKSTNDWRKEKDNRQDPSGKLVTKVAKNDTKSKAPVVERRSPLAKGTRVTTSYSINDHTEDRKPGEDRDLDANTTDSSAKVSDAASYSDVSDDHDKSGVDYTIPSLSKAFSKLLPTISQLSEQDRSLKLNSLMQQSQKTHSTVGSQVAPQRTRREIQIIDHDEIDMSSSREELARKNFLPVSPVNKANSLMPIFNELDENCSVSSTGSGRGSPTPSEEARSLLLDLEYMKKESERMLRKQQQMQEEMTSVKDRFHGSFDAMETRVERNRQMMKDNILDVQAKRSADSFGERAKHFLALSPSYKSHDTESIETDESTNFSTKQSDSDNDEGGNTTDGDSTTGEDENPSILQESTLQESSGSIRKGEDSESYESKGNRNDVIDQSKWSESTDSGAPKDKSAVVQNEWDESSTDDVPITQNWATNGYGVDFPPLHSLRVSKSLMSTTSSAASTLDSRTLPSIRPLGLVTQESFNPLNPFEDQNHSKEVTTTQIYQPPTRQDREYDQDHLMLPDLAHPVGRNNNILMSDRAASAAAPSSGDGGIEPTGITIPSPRGTALAPLNDPNQKKKGFWPWF